MSPPLSFTAVLAANLLVPAIGLDNGLALRPPMGFRTWNQFGLNVNSSLMTTVFEALARADREVDGKPTSLVDLGYVRAGIDDGWQLCGSGPTGTGFHNRSGYPIVDRVKFPDMRALTAAARRLGVIPGWYGNNCHCHDRSAICTGSQACYDGDVAATVDFGFGSLKVDSCGAQKNFSAYAPLFNATGVQVLLENCHEGYPRQDPGGGVVCPMHLFRTSKDIRPTYGAVITNLLTVDQYNSAGLTGPGCWAYPDMLEVGVTEPQPPGALHKCATNTVPCLMNSTEQQTHFSSWAINSSPLILGLDLTDNKAVDAAWPIIANPEVIAINQAWAGDPGRRVRDAGAAPDTPVTVPNCGSGTPCSVPQSLVYAKRLPVPPSKLGWARSATAVLLINNANSVKTVSANLSQVWLGPCGAGCTVRDTAKRTDLGNITGSTGVLTATIEPHASLLAVLTSPNSAPPEPPQPGPMPPPTPPAPMPPGACSWVLGTGLQGPDIRNVETPTKEGCCAACIAEPQCAAACFRPPNHTGIGGKGCHLKRDNRQDPGGAGDADAVVCIPHRHYTI